MNNFLPIGSVVLLKGAQKRLMIIGRFQVAVESRQIYDYSACLYPEGLMNPKDVFLFNNDDIERVYYMGMQDEEEFAFCKLLVEEVEKQVAKQKEKKQEEQE